MYIATDLFSIAKKAKHQVTIATARKWQTQYDCQHQSLTWFKYDVQVDDNDKTLAKVLRCSAKVHLGGEELFQCIDYWVNKPHGK